MHVLNGMTFGRVARGVGSRYRALRGHGTTNFESSYSDALALGGDNTELGKAFFSHDGRYITKWTQYLAAYDEQFAPYRDGFLEEDGHRRPIRLLEIGVLHGGSLQLWRDYFGPDASIFGIDINPDISAIDDPDLQVRIGSQDDAEFLRRTVAEMGGVDIVLDDGSHIAKHQLASLKTLFPLLTFGGVYAVEDLHTSYWRSFGGGYRYGAGFIKVVKQLIDDMHGWYHGRGDRLGLEASTQVPKITVYDSLVFIHKAARQRPANVRFGQKSY